MNFLEKDLEEIIFENGKTIDGRMLLRRRGLENIGSNGFMLRQVRLGNYGIADLVDIHYYDFGIYITIYELKKETIDINSLLQVCGYAKGVRTLINDYDVNINCVLIGKNMELGTNFTFIPSVFSNISYITYKYAIDGLEFKSGNDYKLTNPNFQKIPYFLLKEIVKLKSNHIKNIISNAK